MKVQSLCLCWGHQSSPNSACSNPLFLTSAFVHTSPSSQMGCFSCSGCLFSSILSFSYPLLSLASAGLAVAFSFCLSTAITLTCATISYNHYSPTPVKQLCPLYETQRPQTLQTMRLALRPSCANSGICGALTPSPEERNFKTFYSFLLISQLLQPKPTSNYNHRLHSSQGSAHIQINAGDKRRTNCFKVETCVERKTMNSAVATASTVQDSDPSLHICATACQ